MVYLLPILAQVGAMTYLSAQTDLPGLAVPSFDKVAHFAEFALLAFLASRAATGYLLPLRWAFGIGVAVAVAFAAADEIHQRWTPGRSSELPDFAADVWGAFVGAMAHRAWLRRRQTSVQGQ